MWAQSCGHSRVGTIMYEHTRGGTVESTYPLCPAWQGWSTASFVGCGARKEGGGGRQPRSAVRGQGEDEAFCITKTKALLLCLEQNEANGEINQNLFLRYPKLSLKNQLLMPLGIIFFYKSWKQIKILYSIINVLDCTSKLSFLIWFRTVPLI